MLNVRTCAVKEQATILGVGLSHAEIARASHPASRSELLATKQEINSLLCILQLISARPHDWDVVDPLGATYCI